MPELSAFEEQLWSLEKSTGPSPSRHVVLASRIRGALAVDMLQRAFAGLVERHPALRSTFAEVGGEVVRTSPPATSLKYWKIRDLARIPASERERVLADQLRREATAAFDLRKGPLFRVTVAKLADDEHVVLFAAHHLVADRPSLKLIVDELATLYVSGVLPELDADNVLASAPQSRLAEEQVAYWRDLYADLPAATEIRADRPRSAEQEVRSARVVGRLSVATRGLLDALAGRTGTTLEVALLAGMAALLARSTGQRDVVVATTSSTDGAATTIGPFANPLAVRIDTAGSPSFDALVERTRAAWLGALERRDVPLERIARDLALATDPARHPLTQVGFEMGGSPAPTFRFEGAETMPVDVGGGGTKLDLVLHATGDDEGLRLDLAYDASLFEEKRMERLLRRFELLVAALAARPSQRMDDVSLVSEEARRFLPDPTAPLVAAPFRSLAARFDAHAARDPTRLAIDDPTGPWTYDELARRSNQLAHALRARGVREGQVVAIVAERNAMTVCALLAVLKAGAAFTVVDASYPDPAIATRFAIVDPVAWIATVRSPDRRAAIAKALASRGPALHLDAVDPALDPTSPEIEVSSATLAYVAFTSGTSGAPQAIAGQHGPLSHFVEWHASTHAFGPDDRFSALSGLAHDPFLRDVLTPLASGGAVCVPEEGCQLDPDVLAGWLAARHVTVCHLTPSLGEVLALARVEVPTLRWVFFGGELLDARLVQSLRRIAPAATFVNFYGATETPQAMGAHVIAAGATGRVPIGRGIEGVQLLVLTAGDTLASIDEEGEIVVRTPHLARGYLDGDARGFGTNAFTGVPEDRVYRTGDRGSYLADGTIQVLGRSDDQVKIRGFRVELAEVRAALLAQAGVEQVVVVFDDAQRGLVSYVVGDAEPAAISLALRASLPGYMVPAAIVKIDTVPLTRNGKLDRRALPHPPARSAPADEGDEGFTSVVAGLWRTVLGLADVGLHDNFFDLGGHSLLATQLAMRLRDAFAVDVPVRVIFDAPTVAELAERIVSLVLESATPNDLAAMAHETR